MRMQARNWQRPRPCAIDSAAAQAGLVSALQLRPGKLPWIEAAQPVNSSAVSAVPSAGAAPSLQPHGADADTSDNAPATDSTTSDSATAGTTAGTTAAAGTDATATAATGDAAGAERKRLHQQWLDVAYWLCNEWCASAERGILLKELDAELRADNLKVLIHCTPTGAKEEQQHPATAAAAAAATAAAATTDGGDGAAAAVQRVPLGYVITIADVTVGATVLLGRVTAPTAEAQSAAAAAYGNNTNNSNNNDDTSSSSDTQQQSGSKRPQLVTIERIAQGADGRTEGLRSAAQTPAICGRLSARGILLTDVGQLSLGFSAPTLLDLTGATGSVGVTFSQYSDGYGLADVAASDLTATVVPERLLRLVETCLHALVPAGAPFMPKHPVTPVARLALLLVSRKYSGVKGSGGGVRGRRRVTCADVSSDVDSGSDSSGSDSETERASSSSSSATDSSESGEACCTYH
jgi:hypothetical protein